jgi:hypothetical protein
MSALPLKADIDQRNSHVRFVPTADIQLLNHVQKHRGERLAIQLGTERDGMPVIAQWIIDQHAQFGFAVGFSVSPAHAT